MPSGVYIHKLHSEETKQKLSLLRKIKWQDPKYRKKLSIIHKKQWRNPEYRKKMTEALIGRTFSIEARNKMSQIGKQNAYLGKNKGCFKKGKVSGKNHLRWKGGRIKMGVGYIGIWKPNHPFHEKRGYISEHRLIVEQQIGRYLQPKEIVHHINSIRDDNRPENLMLFNRQYAHKKFEMIQKGMKEGEIIFDGRNIHL